MSILAGESFDCIINKQTQKRLDTDNVKALIEDLFQKKIITAEQALSCYKDLEFDVVLIKRKDPALKPKWKAPLLGDNITPQALVDMIGDAREVEKNNDKTAKFLVEALKARNEDRPIPTEEEIKEFLPDGFTLY